jgi:hypothetical protein
VKDYRKESFGGDLTTIFAAGTMSYKKKNKGEEDSKLRKP